jgi:ubiquitin-conjugating enzyme E2 Q
MYQWIVELHSFPDSLPLAADMKKQGVTSIVLEMRFTEQFPFSPPFIRVVKPRFLPFGQGGGGHVTEGGAICMELLTNSGWSAVTTIESVLLQVQLAMGDEERPARLLGGGGRGVAGGNRECYGVVEAVLAYQRACRAHGWEVPDGFGDFAGVVE